MCHNQIYKSHIQSLTVEIALFFCKTRGCTEKSTQLSVRWLGGELVTHYVSDRMVEGQPIHAGEVTITPITRALVIQLPGWLGGLTWNRPAGVRVSVSGQPDQTLPVRDVTRMAVWGILGAGIAAGILMLLLRRMGR
jgi:hypothetical protein